MGMIVEFLATPATSNDDAEAIDILVGSFSVNSLAVAEFFNAIASTELAPLISDGTDTLREVRLPLSLQAALMVQIQSWANSPSDVLRQAFDAVEAAVDEMQWRQEELLVVAR